MKPDTKTTPKSRTPHREFPIVTQIRETFFSGSDGKAYMGPMCIRIGKTRLMMPRRGTVSARQAAHELVQEQVDLPIVVIDCPPWKGKAKHKIVVC